MKGWVLLISLAAVAATIVQGNEREFGWDSGVWGTCTSREAGEGTWFGNDFDLRGYD